MSSWAGGAAYAGVDYSTGIQSGYGGGEGYQYYATSEGVPQQGNPQEQSMYMVNQRPAEPQQVQPQPQYVQSTGVQPNPAARYNTRYPAAQQVQRTVTQRNVRPAAPRSATRARVSAPKRPIRASASRLSRVLGPAMW